jgi:hypothetical protein
MEAAIPDTPGQSERVLRVCAAPDSARRAAQSSQRRGSGAALQSQATYALPPRDGSETERNTGRHVLRLSLRVSARVERC